MANPGFGMYGETNKVDRLRQIFTCGREYEKFRRSLSYFVYLPLSDIYIQVQIRPEKLMLCRGRYKKQ